MSDWIFYVIKIKKIKNESNTSFHYPEWWDTKSIQPLAYDNTDNKGEVWEDCLVRVIADATEVLEKLDNYNNAKLLTVEEAQLLGDSINPEQDYTDKDGKIKHYKFDINKHIVD